MKGFSKEQEQRKNALTVVVGITVVVGDHARGFRFVGADDLGFKDRAGTAIVHVETGIFTELGAARTAASAAPHRTAEVA